jgi:hypothetical protein
MIWDLSEPVRVLELEMMDALVYHEKVSSKKTEALFLTLSVLFFLLFGWRVVAVDLDLLAAALLGLFCFFLFYTLNYRTLEIRLSSKLLHLKFGIFSWRVPLENIAEFGLDDIPALKRMGGAGIHFMFVRGRYRASFNFLEHPRIVIALRNKVGPVQDLSFSTSKPDALLKHIQDAVSAMGQSPVA